MKKTIKLNDAYSVVISKKENGTNYNQFAHILENGDTVAGTSFRDIATKETIIDWAKNFITLQSEDLFPHYQILPANIQQVLSTFKEETYDECGRLLSELKAFGYTFEYYLDAVPFNLTKIQ